VGNTSGGHWVVPKSRLEDKTNSIGMWICMPCQVTAAKKSDGVKE